MRRFQSISATALRYDTPPMRLWDKAKRLGIWNPADIDFSQDRKDWAALADDERDFLLRLTAMFEAGEESVTADILPLMMAISDEGRLEEELYLTSFLWEEAKHVEVFRRFFDDVAGVREDLTRYHTPSYRRIFYDELPHAMGRLRTDRSPIAQARASVTYNMIVEGVLAETGYYVYHQVLQTRGIMPGMQKVSALLKGDESRHLAYGVFLLSRLVAEHGEPLWQAILARMNELVDPAVQIVHEAFACYDPARVPFGQSPGPYVEYAMGQFEKRMARIERARTQTLADVYGSQEYETN
ncbi:MAG: R2-like ligand-binding oxidase [Gemmatimonadetes bacterium]|nr:R2-like ligand-binding oxidase [Gemmatimonadota bacterium]